MTLFSLVLILADLFIVFVAHSVPSMLKFALLPGVDFLN